MAGVTCASVFASAVQACRPSGPIKGRTAWHWLFGGREGRRFRSSANAIIVQVAACCKDSRPFGHGLGGCFVFLVDVVSLFSFHVSVWLAHIIRTITLLRDSGLYISGIFVFPPF